MPKKQGISWLEELDYLPVKPNFKTESLLTLQSPVGWFLSSFVVGASWFMSVKMGVGVLALGG